MIRSYFEFQPIGQGGFYTGKIIKDNRLKDDQFNFVYDCGTLSKSNNLKHAVESFKQSLPGKAHSKKELDVLVLSHLDDDHVNGVSQLLNGIKCKHLFLPYLTPIQRLFVAIRHSAKDTFIPNEFLEFLKSPHHYLLNIEGVEIREIAYILGNQDGNYVRKNNSSEGPINIGEQEFNIENSWENIPTIKLSPDLLEIVNENNKASIVFKEGNNALIINSIWEFYFYNELTDDNKIAQYIEEVKGSCGLNTSDILNQSDLEKILSDPEKLKGLREKYRDIFKKLNETGLIVQHKPIGYKKAIFEKNHFNDWHFHHFDRYHYRYISGLPYDVCENNTSTTDYVWGITLLTGDISLTQIENSEYAQKHLSENLVFQVPHHGSKTGWNKEFLINSGLNRNKRTSAIIPFGYGNKYGHPNEKVLSDLCDSDFDIHFCTQFNSFNYFFELQFK